MNITSKITAACAFDEAALREVYQPELKDDPFDDGIVEGAQWQSAKDQRIILALAAQLENVVGALGSIASAHKPSHDTEEYWLKREHEACATVLATDTKIARNALTDVRKFVEGLGEK